MSYKGVKFVVTEKKTGDVYGVLDTVEAFAECRLLLVSFNEGSLGELVYGHSSDYIYAFVSVDGNVSFRKEDEDAHHKVRA